MMITPWKDLALLSSLLNVKVIIVIDKKLASLWTGRGFIYALNLRLEHTKKSDRNSNNSNNIPVKEQAIPIDQKNDVINIIYKSANTQPLLQINNKVMLENDRDIQSYLIEANFCKYLSPLLIENDVIVPKVYFSGYLPDENEVLRIYTVDVFY